MQRLQKNVPLAPLTTFKIGGPAQYFVTVSSEGDIREAISWAHEHKIPFIILAGGSNVLIPDEGLNMLVIHLSGGHFSFAGTELAADAGCNLLEVIRAASDADLGGWEKLSGIPGTIGGAVRGNAGAFGSEMKDFVHKVEAINMNTGATGYFVKAQCGFAYRQSFFKQNAKWIITRAFIELQRVSARDSIQRIEETIHERELRHLQNVQAAGSFFMNPVAPQDVQERFEKEKKTRSRESRVPAGWLIEKAGMKGATVGGAIASLQHPNYIVNIGTASAKDVLELSNRIKRSVQDTSGVELQEEAVIIANS